MSSCCWGLKHEVSQAGTWKRQQLNVVSAYRKTWARSLQRNPIYIQDGLFFPASVWQLYIDFSVILWVVVLGNLMWEATIITQSPGWQKINLLLIMIAMLLTVIHMGFFILAWLLNTSQKSCCSVLMWWIKVGLHLFYTRKTLIFKNILTQLGSCN